MLSYNPLLSIALTCELLKKLSISRKKFRNECNKILSGLLALGSMYNSKIFDENYYESLILDKDFKDRTCLKIITSNLFEPLMSEDDPKAENLMMKTWHGIESARCDGNIYGYSNMSYIVFNKPKK